MGAVPRLIAGLAGWAAGLFYRIRRIGPPLPGGPVLVVANHPNALLDPLLIFRVGGRPARPLAKAPLFRMHLIGLALRGLGGLPVYRRQDDPTQMEKNDRTFDRAIAALHAGDAVQIYPEGQSHSNPRLTPLRTGAARIALQAEEQADWKLGLRLVPVGLTYERKPFFRGEAAIMVGEPFTVSEWRDSYAADPVRAAQALTAEITQRLEAVTLNLAEEHDAELIETADRLYAREKGMAAWREREPLAERLPRLRAFARGLAWLRVHDPARHSRLEAAVRAYRRLQDLLGASEGDVPPSYRAREVLRYGARYGVLLVLLAPLALLGAVVWSLPYLLPRMVAARAGVGEDAMATWKLGVAMLTYPAGYVVWLLFLGIVFGAGVATVAALLLPISGAAAVVWQEALTRVMQDFALFRRVARRARLRTALAARRADLVREFDEIGERVAAAERTHTAH